MSKTAGVPEANFDKVLAATDESNRVIRPMPKSKTDTEYLLNVFCGNLVFV